MSSTIKLLESTGKGFIRIIKIQKSRLEAMESGTTKRYMVDSITWWRQKKRKETSYHIINCKVVLLFHVT